MKNVSIHKILLLALGTCGASSAAFADNPLGFYAGAAIGESDVRSDDNNFGNIHRFDESHGAWKLITGVRPISLVGLELAYIDFGNPSAGQTNFYSSRNSKQDATTLFGVGYLPIPVPFLDVYGKLGIARLHTNAAETTLPAQPIGCNAIPGCFPITLTQNQWSTDFAYGAGVQWRISGLAVRAEYERISASGGNPDIISLGVTWTF
jgi:opacity protein-like surface antigen